MVWLIFLWMAIGAAAVAALFEAESMRSESRRKYPRPKMLRFLEIGGIVGLATMIATWIPIIALILWK